jgi:hypothetical protein
VRQAIEQFFSPAIKMLDLTRGSVFLLSFHHLSVVIVKREKWYAWGVPTALAHHFSPI